ncbi:MAG: hypothetical protein HRU19_11035 [Pseudobacteriovorax sp.]|nr:hypothetical protein [Pseudobacteriovorax sp.]
MRKFLSVLILVLLTSGCAYRFTNIVMKPPPGIQSIAIEAVYDTSREVVPHQLIWEAVQGAFARNGRLYIVDKSQADALVLLTLSESTVKPFGVPSVNGNQQGNRDAILEGRPIYDPFEYREMRVAGTTTQEAVLDMTLDVEIVNLTSRQRLFSRSYKLGGIFGSIEATSIADRQTHWILYEENLNSSVKSSADGVAASIVRDFLL